MKDLFNEYALSVNHGLGAPKTFFGTGLGANHVFRPDRVIGSRIGLEVDFYHFLNAGVSGPDFNKYESRSNQHFHALNLSVPVALQFNFGHSVRYFFEMGAHLGINVYTRYSADVTHSNYNSPTIKEHVNSKLILGPLFGLNAGIGVRIPFNERLSFLIKPGIGAQVYFESLSSSGVSSGNAYAKLTLGILLHD